MSEPMSDWEFTYTGYDAEQESLREALCTLGNGYVGTRGAAPETSADGVHYPATLVAGVYNRLTSVVEGREVENESLVNVPNWLPLTFRIDRGPWFSIDDVEILEHRQTLELHRGVLVRRTRFRDRQGRETMLAQRRFVHMVHHHLAALETTIRPENWSGTLTVRSALDGTVENRGVARYRELAGRHLEVLDADVTDDDLAWLRVRTVQSRIEIVEAAHTRAWVDGDPAGQERRRFFDSGIVGHELSVQVESGARCRVEKVVALFTSRDMGISEPCSAALEELRSTGDLAELLASHVREWEDLWRRFTIRLEGLEGAARALNVHLFHLLQVGSPAPLDLDAGIPARGLHGEAYRGHIFWDEVFIFPLLNYRVPSLARDLLQYRYRRLPAARRAASEAGHRGAMFPWESASSGREEAQAVHLNPVSGRWVPDDTHRQRHVGAAIAYNVWQFFQVSSDVEFLADYGAELMVEIARFWASLATRDPADDRYDIHGVVGPDEFHDHDPNWDQPGLRNNAYTNVMAAWVLAHAPQVFDALPQIQRVGFVDRFELEADELDRWDEISRRLRVPFHDDGIVSQFEGYEALEELDWDRYRQRYDDIQRLDRILEAEDDNVNRYKASKQADVLMLLYLFSRDELFQMFDRLGYPLDEELLERNIDYYMRRTSHGSTLSGVVHTWVMARANRVQSLDLFRLALDSDIGDIQGGTTAEGIHVGAMAGTVDIVQRCYTGMEVRDGVLRFDPSLPDGIDHLEFRISFRHRWINVELRDHALRLTSEPTDRSPIEVACRGEVVELGSDASVDFGGARRGGSRAG